MPDVDELHEKGRTFSWLDVVKILLPFQTISVFPQQASRLQKRRREELAAITTNPANYRKFPSARRVPSPLSSIIIPTLWRAHPASLQQQDSAYRLFCKGCKRSIQTHDPIFSNRPNLTMTTRLLYGGKDVAFAPYGEYWRQTRSVCVPQLLSNNRVWSFSMVREEETMLMIEKITPSGHGPVNLSEMLITLTNDVVCRAAFGRKYSSNGSGDAVSFNEIFKDFVELIGCFHVGAFMPWLGWVSRINGLQDRVERVVKQFDQFLEGITEEHLERQKKQKNSDDSVKEEKVKDFVDVLIEIERDKTVGLPIDRDSIKALILDVFEAETVTTYTVAEWAMTEILRHPSAMKELQAEVRGLAGSKGQINESDLEKMKYLRASLKETLRFIHPFRSWFHENQKSMSK